METLNVYLRGNRAGTLVSEHGRLQFCYATTYLNQPGAQALSYTLPLRAEPYTGGEVVAFFSNLLPDESVRVRLAQYLGISPGNIFALLKRIGEDCAGAVALVPAEREARAHSDAEFKVLSEADAHAVLSALPERPLNVGAEDFHISGAGAQDKLVACVQNGHIVLPLNGTPSTHIIKPGIPRFPESVFNELYCMCLAKACRLSVAECSVLRVHGIPYYVTTRYDRQQESGKVLRLHQEDFCQLLGYEPSVKYESEGGPRLLQCFQLLREIALPAADIIEFLRRIIFIFLIGNGDAHAKNFSILYMGKAKRLAPAYDLLSTAVYPNLPPKLAMKIDGRNHFDWITRGKFLRMGEKAGLLNRLVNAEIDKLLAQLSKILVPFTEKMQQSEPSSIYSEIQSGIEKRILQLKA
ncbi:MAG: type II toxin-antitoxin system HipA family toxin [Akkermansia sp.]|nr:type II toxin-antitoxin system HipA family toxin [Akkermansia sp.]